MTQYALRLANDADTAARVRMGDSIPFLSAAGKRGARSGLRNDGGGVVTVNEGTMQVSVSPFSAMVLGGATDTQGSYPFVSDDTVTLTLADGDATQDRTDTIAIVIADDSADGAGSTSAALTVVQGTPGGGVPDLPASALPLRDVTVPATISAGTGGLTSSNLGSDRRTYLPLGITPVSGTTERDGLTPAPGTAVYRADADQVEVWNGTAWGVYAPVSDSGWVTLPNSYGESNWTSWNARARLLNGVVFVEFIAKRAGSAIASGSDTGSGTTQFPAGMRPGTIQYEVCSSGEVGVQMQAVIGTDGGLTIRNRGTASFSTGQFVQFSKSFLPA